MLSKLLAFFNLQIAQVGIETHSR